MCKPWRRTITDLSFPKRAPSTPSTTGECMKSLRGWFRETASCTSLNEISWSSPWAEKSHSISRAKACSDIDDCMSSISRLERPSVSWQVHSPTNQSWFPSSCKRKPA